MRLPSLVALTALLSLAAGPAAADDDGPIEAWARRAVRKGRPTPAADVPADVRRLLETATTRAAEGGAAQLAWVFAFDPGQLLALAEVKAIGQPDHGVLTLIALADGVFVAHGQASVPPTNPDAWTFGRAGDVDGDKKGDKVARFVSAGAEGTRRGLVLVRSGPPALARVDLGFEPAAGSKERRVETPVACFARIDGGAGRALVTVRRTSTPGATDPNDVMDQIEVRVPQPDGRLEPAGLYAAQLVPSATEREAVAAWNRSFGGGEVKRQGAVGPCPRDGLMLPARAFVAGGRGAQAFTVVTPPALTAEAVMARLAKMKRLQAAPTVIRFGN